MSVSRECRRENLAVFNSGLAGWFNAALLNAATLVAAAIALLNAALLNAATLVDVTIALFNAALLNAATLVAAAIALLNAALLNAATLVDVTIALFNAALLNAATLVDVTLVDVAAHRFSTRGAELVSFSEKVSAICTIGHILGDISLRDVIVQKFGELLLSNDFHEGTGNIGSADGHDAFDDDAHALLVLVACHFSRHTFELSFHHTD